MIVTSNILVIKSIICIHVHVCTCPLLYTPTCIHGNQYIPIPASVWDVRNLVECKYVYFGVLHKIYTFLHLTILCTYVCLCNTIPCIGHWLGPNWEACVWAGLQPSLLGRTTLLFPDRQQVGSQYIIICTRTCSVVTVNWYCIHVLRHKQWMEWLVVPQPAAH